ncbi:MAG: hypothetical protein WD049_07245 [Candidatus Paceibacterota bacterium]
MNPNTFSVAPATDKGYFDAFEAMRSESKLPYEKAHFGDSLQIPANELAGHAGLQEVLAQNVRAFPNIVYYFGNNQTIRIERQPDDKSLFDRVTVSPGQQKDGVQFAKVCAAAQTHLGATSLSNLSNLLGPEAQRHFEAREVALAKLEKLVATLLTDVERARHDRDKEFQEKEESLEHKFENKQQELEQAQQQRQQQLDQRTEELDRLRKELDDRAAKHARRQHYKEIKEKFQSWSDTFNVTRGTTRLRWHVYGFTILLLLLFGSAAAYFLFQSIIAQDTTHFVVSAIKQVAFTLLFVSTAFFFIRWNNQWFQRHANEEFRLKKMELDIDRASWFVEMAFEWKEEKGEEIPLELIERLTANLFSADSDENPTEPHDSLAQALLGAARFKVKLADGTEVEYDRKGLQKLLRERGAK